MGQAVEPLCALAAFQDLIVHSLTNPWYGLIIGTAFTAIIQKQRRHIAILLALPVAFHARNMAPGIVNICRLLLAPTIGTCVTAFLATLRAESGRPAGSHGRISCLSYRRGPRNFPLLVFLPGILPHNGISMEMQIANAHMLFNVFVSIVCLPLLTPFSEIVLKLVRKKASMAPAYTYNSSTIACLAFQQWPSPSA